MTLFTGTMITGTPTTEILITGTLFTGILNTQTLLTGTMIKGIPTTEDTDNRDTIYRDNVG